MILQGAHSGGGGSSWPCRHKLPPPTAFPLHCLWPRHVGWEQRWLRRGLGRQPCRAVPASWCTACCSSPRRAERHRRAPGLPPGPALRNSNSADRCCRSFTLSRSPDGVGHARCCQLFGSAVQAEDVRFASSPSRRSLALQASSRRGRRCIAVIMAFGIIVQLHFLRPARPDHRSGATRPGRVAGTGGQPVPPGPGPKGSPSASVWSHRLQDPRPHPQSGPHQSWHPGGRVGSLV